MATITSVCACTSDYEHSTHATFTRNSYSCQRELSL